MLVARFDSALPRLTRWLPARGTLNTNKDTILGIRETPMSVKYEVEKRRAQDIKGYKTTR
jgi:hypothetical protein